MRDYPEVLNAKSAMCEEVSTRQRLEQSKKWHEDKLRDIERCMVLLTENPTLEELTDLLRRI